jgi:hypothetical protein
MIMSTNLFAPRKVAKHNSCGLIIIDKAFKLKQAQHFKILQQRRRNGFAAGGRL